MTSDTKNVCLFFSNRFVNISADISIEDWLGCIHKSSCKTSFLTSWREKQVDAHVRFDTNAVSFPKGDPELEKVCPRVGEVYAYSRE
jgi:hypothetical protein